MLYLKKTHDPRSNNELLAQISGRRLDIKKILNETEQLFQPFYKKNSAFKPRNPSIPFKQKIIERLFRLLAKPSARLEPTRLSVDSEGNVIPNWKDSLDQEFTKLMGCIKLEVNVEDFGAVGDGFTDNTSAFKKAIGNGRVKVIVPPGVYNITKGIRIPSWTCLIGAGKGVTTIRLHDSAPKGMRLVTNTNHWRGNHHIFVQGLSLDWNVERLGDTAKTSTWGNHSSCLTYANVTYGWVKDVEAINPGLHCFDITSTLYNYAGDGFRARGGSKYVWLDNLNGHGFGDDGITTHHSDYIWISNSHMCDPSGRAHQIGFSNSNGIEVDDGSRNVLLVNNSTARCFGGVEIKAHQNSSAASNVQIVGHISLNDNRSFNFRHIGHHKSTDMESQSAYNILAINLASIAPIFTDLYKESTPRGLVVSAYKNVVLNYVTFIGDPGYDYKGNPIVAIQYRARNVALNNVSFKNFKTAGAGIKVFGGDNRADGVQIRDVVIQDSTVKAVQIGASIQDVNLHNIKELKPQT
ncbi:glycoside hydrolase family 55 protein [Neobacillus sp. 114]|uniref:glycoside hydrolase family 55 protein n=1 Tax=Neobacillus sp. 114 TaxID=3048535 RepID=UPI001C220E25|nr:glycoside hydrolase family 55 protein [Neobacillus sp. 114]MBU8917889.1 glycoside hydrolase family 55 protein [Bacillus sp. FJAT-29953]